MHTCYTEGVCLRGRRETHEDRAARRRGQRAGHAPEEDPQWRNRAVQLHPRCAPSGLSFVLNVVADVQTCAPVVGQEELDNRSVNVRNRDDVGTKARTESLPLDVIIGKLSALKETRGIHNKLA